MEKKEARTFTIAKPEAPKATFAILGNVNEADALANVTAGKVKRTLIDVYKTYDRTIWYDIAAACFNDKSETDGNKAARYWRASARKHVKMAGSVKPVIDYIFTEGNVQSLTTLARTYCPSLYEDAKAQLARK